MAQSNYEPYLFTTFAGPVGDRSGARFYYPSGVAVDSVHNIYVADTGNSTIRKISPDGTSITLAGLAGMTGSADGSGGTARFYFPKGVAVDAMGNVYVADTLNHTIRKITPAGVVSTPFGLAGSPGSADGNGTNARFYYPAGVAMGPGGNVFVADTGNHTIRKITLPAGDVSTPAGLAGSPGSADGTGNAAHFDKPSGVAVDSGGNAYVADTANHTIRKITPAGVVSTPFGLAGSPGSADGNGTNARFDSPRGVAMGPGGNVFVADTGNHTIRKITLPAGDVSTLAGLAGSQGSADGTGRDARFKGPEGIVVDDTGNLDVADASNHTIRGITPTGVVGVVTTVAGLAGGSGSIDRTDARFDLPQSVAVDATGNLYVADTLNHTVRKITFSNNVSVVSTLAGLDGSPGSADGSGNAARFDSPQGVAVDANGNVYVADTGNHTIRKITPAGFVSTPAGLAGNPGHGDGDVTLARFYSPQGVAVGPGGNVYVADTGNHTIRKITLLPGGVIDVTTPAGLAGSPGSADGTGSAARFFRPSSLAVDDSGNNAYVADSGNHTIRKITLTAAVGVVSTLAGLAGSPGSADGDVTLARFYYPQGVAVGPGGNVYVADTGNSTIRKITLLSGGVIDVTTPAGLAAAPGSANGLGNTARFYYPSGVAVGSGGNAYVADTYNNAIRKITFSGNGGDVSTLAGSTGIGSADGTGNVARFYYPSGVAVDSAGNVYVADTLNDTIRKITPAGVVSTLAGSAGMSGSADGNATNARFYYPSGVAVGPGGNVYVADLINNTIRKITLLPGGVIDVSTLAGLAGSSGSADGHGTAARFFEPSSVAVDNGGNVYVADSLNHTIRRITPGGDVTTPAGLAGSPGSANGVGSAARFYFPYGVAVDSGGNNAYVADSGNSTIRKIMLTAGAGVVSTLAGLAGSPGSADGTGNAAHFYYPSGVAVDSFGNAYVADSGNNTIRKITPGAVVSTLAGLTGQVNYGSADGTGSAARFNDPIGVAVDTTGKVYVADSRNHAIRRGVPPPFIESPPLAIGTVNLQFVYQIEAAGASSFGASNLPPGLLVDTTLGIIYGIPTLVGTYVVPVSASAQWTTTATLTIDIRPEPSPGHPVIASGASVKGRTGSSFVFDVIATGNAPANITTSALPPGLSVDPATGHVTGTPTSDGTSLVTLTATNGMGTHTTTLQLTFVSDSTVPVITSAANVTLTPGQLFSYTITATANPTFRYVGADGMEHQGQSCAGLPTGLCFDGINKISGTYNPPSGHDGEPKRTSGISGGIVTVGPRSANNPDEYQPDTTTIRPPLISICQLIANHPSGTGTTGTAPLNFLLPGYIITVSASPDAAGKANGVYNTNSNVTVVATPNSGFTFVDWTDADGFASSLATYSFTATQDRALTANFILGGTPTPTPTPPPEGTPTPTPGGTTPTPTPGGGTPTPTPTPINISGAIPYCSNPVPGPVPNVTLTLTGSASSSILSDGTYRFSSLAAGGSYTVTPTKAALAPGSAGVSTFDVLAVQRHFLNFGNPLSGCRRDAADVNADSMINTFDIIAIQRFFLGLSTGTANVGKYKFTPASRTYSAVVTDQTGQNYDTLVFGDVAAPFAEQSAFFDPNANGVVFVVVVQPEGKILIGGGFTILSPNGGVAVTRNHIARLNPDGTIDTAFNPNANNRVLSIAVQADGKILVGGDFTSIGGETRNTIARLNSDGTLDTAFNPNANNSVQSILVQADGKILVGGDFTSIGGQTRNFIARLNTTTGLADSFNPDANGEVISIAVQADGKILAGGGSFFIGGQFHAYIARLDATTGLADAFNPNADGRVGRITVQADGKILVGGDFRSIGGQTRNFIARLDAATGLADSFDPNANNSVRSIAVQTDGKILAGGDFSGADSIGGQTRNRIARLDATSGLADSFDANANDAVESIAVQADGKVLVGGYFASIGGQTRNYIARLDATTGLARSVNPNVSDDGDSIALQGDGTSAGEVPATVAAVALPEVAVDQAKSNFIAAVRTTVIDAENKLVGFQGDFTFDERVVTFQSEPVQKAGLTGGNWNVSGNILDGPGPIRTLRISAFSNDFTPLSGSGTLFELNMIRMSNGAQGTPLIWAAPPEDFIFIDADLNAQKPGNAAAGSVTTSGKRK